MTFVYCTQSHILLWEILFHRQSAAEIRINQKIAKYLNLSNQSGSDFLPVVLESTGSMHRDVALSSRLLPINARSSREDISEMEILEC